MHPWGVNMEVDTNCCLLHHAPCFSFPSASLIASEFEASLSYTVDWTLDCRLFRNYFDPMMMMKMNLPEFLLRKQTSFCKDSGYSIYW